MKNCILINSYPINPHKINLLLKQITNLKLLKLPIILCAGCDVPNNITNLVDYLVINKNKIIKPAIFQKTKFLEGQHFIAAWFQQSPDIVTFTDNIDPTITANIKLLFTLAKFFGFHNAMYTEDDNIFNNADDFIYDQLSHLNSNKSKMCASITPFSQNIMGIHTTHFFSNVDFLLENYTIPHDLNELDNHNNLRLWQPYETSIYKCFEKNLKDIRVVNIEQFIDPNFRFNRNDSMDYLINNIFSLVKFKDNTVSAYFNNTSSKLYFNVNIIINGLSISYNNFVPRHYIISQRLALGDIVEIQLADTNTNISMSKRIIYDSDHKILSLEYDKAFCGF